MVIQCLLFVKPIHSAEARGHKKAAFDHEGWENVQ
jgi:hypothetical protein